MMTRHLATACLIYVSLALQSSVAADLTIYGSRPWFPGIVLILCAWRHSDIGCLLWSAVLGLAVDGVSAERVGIHVAITTLITMGLVIARQEILTCGSLLAGTFVLIGTFLWKSGSAMTLLLLAGRTPDLTPMFFSVLRDSLYNLILTIGFLSAGHLMTYKIRNRDRTPATVLTNRWTMLTG